MEKNKKPEYYPKFIKLLDFIDPEICELKNSNKLKTINWYNLIDNPSIFTLQIIENLGINKYLKIANFSINNNYNKNEEIFWNTLCEREHSDAIYLLEKNPDKINWIVFSLNPSAIHLLEQNQDKINWTHLSENFSAIHLLEQNQDKINWSFLSKNPNAIHLLEQNQDKINWSFLSQNPSAIHLLEKNQDKINWKNLSFNPSAIHLLEKNQDNICWWRLSENPSAIHLLEKNQDKINWNNLSRNPAIFEYDYKEIEEYFHELNKEFIEYYYNPKRINFNL